MIFWWCKNDIIEPIYENNFHFELLTSPIWHGMITPHRKWHIFQKQFNFKPDLEVKFLKHTVCCILDRLHLIENGTFLINLQTCQTRPPKIMKWFDFEVTFISKIRDLKILLIETDTFLKKSSHMMSMTHSSPKNHIWNIIYMLNIWTA